MKERKIKSVGRRKRVFIVDQFQIIRMAVAEWLRDTPDLAVCGEADSALGALARIGHLRPDVVVTEIMRQQDLGFIQGLRRHHSHLPILVFSFRDEEWYAPRALEAGADGYLMKGITKEALVAGIRGTLEGRIVLSSEMRARLLLKCRRSGRVSRVRQFYSAEPMRSAKNPSNCRRREHKLRHRSRAYQFG